MNRSSPHTLYLAPAGSGVGLTTVSLGLVRALDARGVRVAFCKPIGQSADPDPQREPSTRFIRDTTQLRPAAPLPLAEAARLVTAGEKDELMARVVALFHNSSEDADVVVVEGLAHTPEWPMIGALNRALVQALSADVLFVGRLAGRDEGHLQQLDSQLELAVRSFDNLAVDRLLGCIVNHVPQSLGKDREEVRLAIRRHCPLFRRRDLRIVGAVPEKPELAAPRAVDVARHLGAVVVNEGELHSRRVRSFTLVARTVPNMLGAFRPGKLLVTPSDRADVFVAAGMAEINRVNLAGIILTGDSGLPPGILDLCRPALQTGLPVLKVPTKSWETASAVSRMPQEVPLDDVERMRDSMDFVAAHIDAVWLAEKAAAPVEARMSPAAFCYQLVERARQQPKRIVLPEGEEPRTVRAAAACTTRGIARCILIGRREEILRVAAGMEVQLPEGVEIIDPQEVRHRYIAPLVAMRREKGLTPEAAADLLQDNVWLGTAMLALDEVDGLVSGAIHTSANTIRPALQIIKTKPEAKVVSSIFFMCLPDQVLVYGDCAVNPDPDAEMLADIAVQSADSALQMGIAPKVAMISYSTGESGSGADVEKVREATRLARLMRPELAIDGPLQYDAAAIADVAATKAPSSSVAGRATVFIFPDLNTGNTTYKAVQRSANVISIGPVLQGLKRPVNDLSRGALVEDIIYTIAITAIQATSRSAAGAVESHG